MGKCEYEGDEREKIKQSREQEFEEKTQDEVIKREKFREKRYQMMNERKHTFREIKGVEVSHT